MFPWYERINCGKTVHTRLMYCYSVVDTRRLVFIDHQPCRQRTINATVIDRISTSFAPSPLTCVLSFNNYIVGPLVLRQLDGSKDLLLSVIPFFDKRARPLYGRDFQSGGPLVPGCCRSIGAPGAWRHHVPERFVVVERDREDRQIGL